MQERKPAVSGQFYPGTKSALEKQLELLIPKITAEKINAFGAVVPHAGYIYSGGVAGLVYASISPKKTYIILGPNHTGIGQAFSIMDLGAWLTPLGKAEINQGLAQEIIKSCPQVEIDTSAHSFEHSLEVQLPFLQYIVNNFDFVPIVLSQASLSQYQNFGKALSEVIKNYKHDVVILASSDMTHYEPHEEAKRKDKMAIDAILNLDVDELAQKIARYDITMCGWAPVIVMITACKAQGATKAKLIKYQTSGDTSGDYSSVVGYAGIAIF